MSLIRKTVVISHDSAIGYITLIKVGSTVGAKLNFSEEPPKGLWLALKVGDGKQFLKEITAQKEEFEIDSPLNESDLIGVAVLNKEGMPYASGGNKDIINFKSAKEEISNALLPKADNQEVQIEEKVENLFLETEPNTSKVFAEDKESVTRTQESVTENQEPVTGKEEFVANEKHEKESVAVNKEDFVAKATKTADSKIMPKLKIDNFYQTVRGRMEEIFTINPRETLLEELVPDSKWVKVFYDKGEYYVVGMLTNEGKITHIAYGVPGAESIKPPKEAENFCDFLHIKGLEGAEGYHLMFQNADDGLIASKID
ncbi:MAG: hypothetical protein FWD49_08130 [Firmicutes bacterium]|nr:hypothetical protein [Bacillota bacterium]